MSSLPLATAVPQSTPILRLYYEEKPIDPREEALKLTLREAFVTLIRPKIPKRIKESTITCYNDAFSGWERYTSNPPLANITDEETEDFRLQVENAIEKNQMSPATYNKWMRHLRAVFNRLAPRDTRNKRGMGILTYSPLLEPLQEELSDPRVAPRSSLSRIYDQCYLATWPLVERPDEEWRTLLVSFFNFGPRRCDLMGLRWPSISFRHDCIKLRAQKTGKPLIIPMHPVVSAHFKKLHRYRIDDRVFHFTKSFRDFYNQFYAIQTAAGIAGPFCPQDLRHTCGSAFDEISPGLGAIVLGHAPKGVFERYYRNHGRRLRKAVLRLKQPPAFERILSQPDVEDPQLQLFD